MMEERFEKYISENRAEFDYRTPPEGLWNNIKSQLTEKSGASYLRYWQAAAVIFFVVSLGLFIRSYQPMDLANNVSQTDIEFEATEEYYLNVIEDQQGILTSYLKQYPELATDFEQDLTELNQNYNKLKKDFKATGDIVVLNALIKNLQLQQELLSNQLHIIQQIEEENENVSI